MKLNQKLIDYAQEVLLPLGCKVARFRNNDNAVIAEYKGNLLSIDLENDKFNFRAVFKHNEKYVRVHEVFTKIENPDAHEIVIGSMYYSQNAKIVQAYEMFENIEDYMVGKNMNFLVRKALKMPVQTLCNFEVSDVVELDYGYLTYIEDETTNKAVLINKSEVANHLGYTRVLKSVRGEICLETISNQSDELEYTPIEIYIDNNLKDILKEIIKDGN